MILFILVGAVIPTAFAGWSQPDVIGGLTYPSHAVVGIPVIVTFEVSYWDVGVAPLLLLSAIDCLSNSICGNISSPMVFSTPLSCKPAYPFSMPTSPIFRTCYTYVTGMGIESFSYTLLFNQAGIYSLLPVVEYRTWNNTMVPGWDMGTQFTVVVCNVGCNMKSIQLAL